MKDSDPVEKVLVGARVSRETQIVLKMMAAQHNQTMADELREAVDRHVERFRKEEIKIAL